jgi:uncharacterized protein with PQ loop repeat
MYCIDTEFWIDTELGGRAVDVWVGLAYLGATFGVVMVVPQILRTVRNPGVGGVSPVSWALTALACSTWLTYGLRTATWPQVPGNVLLVSGAVAIVLLVPSVLTPSRRALRLVVVAAALLGTAWVLPSHSVGYLAFAVGLVSAWPQVFDSVQTWRAGEPSAVSVSTWVLKVASQSCWLVYAVAARDLSVTISAVAALSTALALVLLEASTQGLRRGAAPVEAFEPA